ncbi:aspartic peptidase domain-containing protein, partial [Zopfochytrium polystomum]
HRLFSLAALLVVLVVLVAAPLGLAQTTTTTTTGTTAIKLSPLPGDAPPFAGTISIGTPPQSVNVIFSTFHFTSWVTAKECNGCARSTGYSANASSTHANGSTSERISPADEPETDEAFKAVIALDTVTIGGATDAAFPFTMVVNSTVPMDSFNRADGKFSLLGVTDITEFDPEPRVPFLYHIKGGPTKFSLSYAPDLSSGNLTLNPTTAVSNWLSASSWAWDLPIQTVSFADTTADIQDIATLSHYITIPSLTIINEDFFGRVPTVILKAMHRAISGSALELLPSITSTTITTLTVPCGASGPPLAIKLTNAVTLSFPPSAYIAKYNASACKVAFWSFGEGHADESFVRLGYPALRQYTTVFDMQANRVAFVVSPSASAAAGLAHAMQMWVAAAVAVVSAVLLTSGELLL